MLQVTIQIAEKAAEALMRKGTSAVANKIQSAVKKLGYSIQPMHPGVDDPELLKHFYISVPDERSGEEVSAKLREMPGIEAAYFKPPGAPPG
jgi:hypothetical protein